MKTEFKFGKLMIVSCTNITKCVIVLLVIIGKVYVDSNYIVYTIQHKCLGGCMHRYILTVFNQ